MNAITLRVADAVHVFDILAALLDGGSDNLECPFLVVLCGISRLESFTRRGDVGVSDVREYLDCAVWVVLDYASSKLVGASFEAECVDWLGGWLEWVSPRPDDSSRHDGGCVKK